HGVSHPFPTRRSSDLRARSLPPLVTIAVCRSIEPLQWSYQPQTLRFGTVVFAASEGRFQGSCDGWRSHALTGAASLANNSSGRSDRKSTRLNSSHQII